MNINQVMHLLAVRKRPELSGIDNDYYWIENAGSQLGKRYACIVCGHRLEPFNDAAGCDEHALKHIRENNLLALL